jgi:capsular exopolysaccharide synthesis family protein
MGKKVLLVDGDLRRAPRLRSSAGEVAGAGLSGVLAGSTKAKEAIEEDDERGFSIIRAGYSGANPVSLLSADHLKEVIDQLAREHDIVIVDGPPIMGLADAVLLARSVEAVLVVVEANRIRSGELDLAVSRLPPDNVLGSVITKFDPRSAGVRYGGYDYYSYQPQT